MNLRITDTDPADLGQHQVSIRIDQAGQAERLLVDGVDVSSAVSSLRLTAYAGRPAYVTLGLSIVLTEVEGKANLEIPRATATALVQLGWTPPQPEPKGTDA